MPGHVAHSGNLLMADANSPLGLQTRQTRVDPTKMSVDQVRRGFKHAKHNKVTSSARLRSTCAWITVSYERLWVEYLNLLILGVFTTYRSRYEA